jgi:hypothetical protein
MVSIEAAAKILNKNNNYSKEEVEQILDFLNPIVEILVDYTELDNNRGEK